MWRRRRGRKPHGFGMGMSVGFPGAPTERDLLSLADVAYRLSVSRTTVWRLVREGRLPVVRIGSRTLVPRSAVESLAASAAEGGSQ